MTQALEKIDWMEAGTDVVKHIKMNQNQHMLLKLEDIYVNFVTEELKLMSIISDLRKEQWYVHSSGIIGEASAELVEEYIKITVNKIPEKVEVWKTAGTQYTRYVREYWIGNIVYALQELRKQQHIAQYQECAVIIKVLKSGGKDWDIDNQNIKHIIDGIRYSSIIPNDYWFNVQYHVLGGDTKDTNRTEIYVTDRKNFINVFQHVSE